MPQRSGLHPPHTQTSSSPRATRSASLYGEPSWRVHELLERNALFNIAFMECCPRCRRTVTALAASTTLCFTFWTVLARGHDIVFPCCCRHTCSITGHLMSWQAARTSSRRVLQHQISSSDRFLVTCGECLDVGGQDDSQ